MHCHEGLEPLRLEEQKVILHMITPCQLSYNPLSLTTPLLRILHSSSSEVLYTGRVLPLRVIRLLP